MAMAMRDPKNGLVLTGGGARAAYQVGVLRAIAVITNFKINPFRVISGYSAGAINGAWLAGRSEDFDHATRHMWQVWSELSTEQVYKTSPISLAHIAFRWLRDRGLAGPAQQITYLLDTEPLDGLLRKHIGFEALSHQLKTHHVTLSVTAVNYSTGQSVSFFEGTDGIEGWTRLNRIAVQTKIRPEHVMASSAIPIFFPPVPLNDGYYGDGMVRLNAPLSAPIHMGADKLIVIGIRGPSSKSSPGGKNPSVVSLGEIAGTILNGLFFDALDADIARMERVNRTVAALSPEELRHQPDHLRHIPLLSLRPSQEVANLSTNLLSSAPTMIRFLLKGIGLEEDKGQDLLSYLFFEQKYLRSLLEIGYEDTLHRKDEILEFFETSGHDRCENPVHGR